MLYSVHITAYSDTNYLPEVTTKMTLTTEHSVQTTEHSVQTSGMTTTFSLTGCLGIIYQS